MVYDLMGAYILLASGIVANRYLLSHGYITAPFLVSVRMLISSAAIILFSARTSPRFRWNYLRHDIAIIALIAIVSTLIPAYLKAYALTTMPAAKQTLIGSIDPFITAFYAYMLWGEPITRRKMLGIAIGFCGIAVSLIAQSPEDALWHSWFFISWPELASIASVAAGRYGWILVQNIMKRERYLPHEVTSITMGVAGLGALLLAWNSPSAPHFINVAPDQIWMFLSVLCYTVFIGNIFGYTAYSYALKAHSSTIVSLVGLSMPILVALIEWMVGLNAPPAYFFTSVGLLAIGFAIFFNVDSLLKSYYTRQL